MLKDEGAGLTKEEFDNLFRPFISPGERSAGEDDSERLRLTIIKILVDAHKGEIYVESEEEGEGSVITVMLPLFPEPEKE